MKTYQELDKHLKDSGFSIISHLELTYNYKKEFYCVSVQRKEPNIIKRIIVRKDSRYTYGAPEILFDEKRPGKSAMKKILDKILDWNKVRFAEFYENEMNYAI
jgi:hypothetical protein